MINKNFPYENLTSLQLHLPRMLDERIRFCGQYGYLTEEQWMVTLFSYESVLKRSWFSNMIFLLRSGVCDPIMHLLTIKHYITLAWDQIISSHVLKPSLIQSCGHNPLSSSGAF